MVSQITNALASGFSAKQVLDFIIKKFPKHKDQIQSAMAAGFTVEQVLKYLSGGRKELSQESSSLTEHQKTRDIDEQRRASNNKNALLAGSTAAATLAAPMAASALQRAIPSNLQQLIPGLIPQGSAAPQQNISPGLGSSASNPIAQGSSLAQQNLPQISNLDASQSPIKPSAPNQYPTGNLNVQPGQLPPVPIQSTTNIQQNTQPVQPEIKINATEILDKYDAKKHIDNLSKNNTPDSIKGFFQKFHKDTIKKIEKETGQPFEKVVEQYLNERSQVKKPTTEMLPESNESVEEPKKIEKASTVITPHGIGEVKEIRGGQAIIDVDGKKHKISEEDLIQSPLPEKDLADLYDDVIAGIEKATGQQVSRNVEWAGYDPKTNELAYKPHGSDRLYAYDDISPEDIEQLTNLLTQRKSTGSNFIGAWEKGTASPIGAAMHKLIMKLQGERGGKGNEYKNRYETIYDALEPAKLAKKKKHAETKRKKKT